MKFSLLSDWLTDFCHAQFKQISTQSGYTLGLVGIGLFFLCLVSWKILLALALGSAIALLVYDLQSPASWFHARHQDLQPWLKTPAGMATVAGSGTVVGLLTLFGLSAATGRGWIAALLMLQGIACVSLFGIWRSLSHRPQVSPDGTLPLFDRYIGDLAHSNSMRRLIAIRRLQHHLQHGRIPAFQKRELHDYFELLLDQEVNPLLRVAIQDALACYEQTRVRHRLPEADPLARLTMEHPEKPLIRPFQPEPELYAR